MAKEVTNEVASAEDDFKYNAAFAKGLNVNDVEEYLYGLFKNKHTTKKTIYGAIKTVLEQYNLPGYIEIQDLNLVSKEELHEYAVILVNNLRAYESLRNARGVENFTRAAKNLSKVIEELEEIHTAVDRASRTNSITKPAKVKLLKSVAKDVLERARQDEFQNISTGHSTPLINAKLAALASAVATRIEELKAKMEEYIEFINEKSVGANDVVCDYYGCQCGKDEDDEDYEDDDEDEEDIVSDEDSVDNIEMPAELKELLQDDKARKAVDLFIAGVLSEWGKNAQSISLDLSKFNIEVKSVKDGFDVKLRRKKN